MGEPRAVAAPVRGLRTLLLVSAYFSDNVVLGSLRMRGLAKYLPRYGWRAVVLTPRLESPALSREEVELVEYTDLYAGAKRGLGLAVDESLAVDRRRPGATPRGEQSLRLRAARLARPAVHALALPDVYVGWYPFAVREVLGLVRSGRLEADALLSSSNPRTAHLIGYGLHRRLRIPWIADLRDLWTLDHYYLHGALRRSLETRLERRILSRASALVTISEPYARRLGSFLGREVAVVPHGFDPDEVSDGSQELTKTFSITYTGSLAGGTRDPRPLFAALRDLDLRDVEVRFYGPRDPRIDAWANEYGLEEVVRQHGFVERAEALAKQRESQLLLILLRDHPHEEGVVTGKIEYLAARRPILTVGGRGGSLHRLLEETGAGVCVPSGDGEGLKRVLRDGYAEYVTTGRVSYRGRDDDLAAYSHVEMAARFARLLDGLR